MKNLSKYTEIVDRELSKSELELVKLMDGDSNYIAYKDINGNIGFTRAKDIAKMKDKSESWDNLKNAVGKYFNSDKDAPFEEVGELAATAFGYL